MLAHSRCKAERLRPRIKPYPFLKDADAQHIQRLAEGCVFKDLSDYDRKHHMAVIARSAVRAAYETSSKEANTQPRTRMLGSLFTLACLTGVPACNAGRAAGRAYTELLSYGQQLQNEAAI